MIPINNTGGGVHTWRVFKAGMLTNSLHPIWGGPFVVHAYCPRDLALTFISPRPFFVFGYTPRAYFSSSSLSIPFPTESCDTYSPIGEAMCSPHSQLSPRLLR
jgi:hypothetical protein